MRCQFDDDVFDQSVGVMSFFEFFFFLAKECGPLNTLNEQRGW
jgi:hypothetical protein